MVDLRDALRPLVDDPPEGARSVAEIAEQATRRARLRRTRRRATMLAVSAVLLLVLVSTGPLRDGSGNVTEVAPSGDGSSPDAGATSPDEPSSPEDGPPGTPKEPAATTSTTSTGTEPATTTPPASESQAPRPAGPHDPFAGLEAEHHDTQHGVAVTGLPGGGHAIRVGDGGHVAFHDVDFGTSLATRFEVRVAPLAGRRVDGTVEVRLHAVDSPPFGTLRVTGSTDQFVTISVDTSAIGGRADVYVTFTSSEGGDFALVDWFRFRP